MYERSDTIAAVATAKGEGGIAIIRISGNRALEIVKTVFRPFSCPFEPSKMYYGHITDENGADADEVMCVYFKAPKTYTREDVCEVHCHGGSFITGRVLEIIVAAGARPAERGEFTYRAFAGGRIDLSKAEAVMQLIQAGSDRAARSALRQLDGGVSSRIGRCRERLLEMLTLIDAAADFPEEIDEDVTAERVKSEARGIIAELERACDRRYARLLSDGARVVIAGRPNVGKSSLMNALLCADRAIVSDIAGTTRDVISESVVIDGLKYTFTDTAGIHETGDAIEKLGVDRAVSAVNSADCVILMLDGTSGLTDEDRQLMEKRDGRYITAVNKCDGDVITQAEGIRISARTGEGLDRLLEEVKRLCAVTSDDEKLMSLRHIACAERARDELYSLMSAPFLDLMREDATRALMSLGEITGEDISESVIDGIFERFCVGK